MKTGILSGVLALASICPGCISTGFQPREVGSMTAANYVMSLPAESGRGGARGPVSIRRPMRVGVAEIGESTPPSRLIDRLAARRSLFGTVDPIPANGGMVSHRHLYTDEAGNLPSPHAQLSQMMGLARQLGDDYLLVLGGNIDQSQSLNQLSVLDLTIIGMFIIPSHQLIADGKASAAIIDVRTEQVIAIVSADARDTKVSTTVNQEGATMGLAQSVRDDLMDKIGVSIIKRVEQ